MLRTTYNYCNLYTVRYVTNLSDVSTRTCDLSLLMQHISFFGTKYLLFRQKNFRFFWNSLLGTEITFYIQFCFSRDLLYIRIEIED
jgi:hypothetical protein